MISPAEQKIIQIDITNACIHQCSNCTRFCGHHRAPYYMAPATFATAVASLREYPGMVGVMGGEPTIHPQFEQLVQHLHAERPERSAAAADYALAPIRDFALHKALHLSDVNQRCGLWTSLGKNYRKHYELIQDVFAYQCINDHSNPGLHQALLISRRELGIADTQWLPLRDNCWVQRLWSASITPKGAFFCEVAGALDMLFDGPGGWPVEPGWWRRTPDQFGDQLQWCELCSAALRVPSRRANEQIDDVSPLLYARLQAVGSPKLKRGKVKVFNPAGDSAPAGSVAGPESYLPQEDHRGRVGREHGRLQTHIDIVATVGETMLQVRDPADASRWECREALEWDSTCEWIILTRPSFRELAKLETRFSNWILNPGCAYCLPDCHQPELLLFHPRAAALAAAPGRCETLDLAAMLALWPEHKRQVLNLDEAHWDQLDRNYAATLAQATRMLEYWDNLWTELGSARIALFGGGAHSEWLIALLNARGHAPPVLILDDAPKVARIYGVPVMHSAQWAIATQPVDVIVISSDTIAAVLTQRAEAVAPAGVRVVNPYANQPCAEFKKIWNFL